ncbi:MAG: GNAT family N-acetyltransferase [Candidatus Nanoarchaeia archaeon]|jgi:ribosomal protein S18 acetylase RimI-like enzyme
MKLVKASVKYLDDFEQLEREFLKYNESLGIDTQYYKKKASTLSKDYFAKDFRSRLNKRNKFFYFIKEGDNFCGYIYGYIIKMSELYEIGKIGYLDGIIISKKHRGKGYASLLKDKFFEWLKKQEVSLCQINVAEKNKPTMEVYKHWGFTTDELRLIKKV